MKVRFYPNSYDATLSEMVSLGMDKDGNGFYIIDVKDVTEHKAKNDQVLPSIIHSRMLAVRPDKKTKKNKVE